jgi:hypothetical protein
MTWNYRIIKKHGETFSKEDEYYVLTEVYYKDDGSLQAFSNSEYILSTNKEGIIKQLETMLQDAKKDIPILTEKDFE